MLLDEVDRMQKEELLVLLKILRGASSMPNVTFICAFSREEIQRVLDTLTPECLEKFFPVSVTVSAPEIDMLGACFQERLREALETRGWFKTNSEKERFAELLREAWQDSLSKVCTNFRKIGLLLNDALAAPADMVREVDPFDLTVVAALRRFYPSVHKLLAVKGRVLAYGGGSMEKGEFFTPDEKKAAVDAFLNLLNKTVAECSERVVVETLLSRLFPHYKDAGGGENSLYISLREATEDEAERGKRICSWEYFPAYFRWTVPENVFSDAELGRLKTDLGWASSADMQVVFDRCLDSISYGSPKRADFFWKLIGLVDGLGNGAARSLAVAVARRSDRYAPSIFGQGEWAYARNLVFAAARKLSATHEGQGLLEEAIGAATEDEFALQLAFMEKDRNRILTDYTNIDVMKVKGAFMERMRKRYGSCVDVGGLDLRHSDWGAFRTWVQNSNADRELEQDFWRRYIGGNRRKLGRAINFIYPAGSVWKFDPTQILDSFYPLREIDRLLKELPDVEQLDELEMKGIERIQKLIEFGYQGMVPS